MDWVMCLLPMAVCFVGVLLTVKISRNHKRVLAAAGVVLFLCVAFGSLVVYRVQKIAKPIRESDTLAVAEMNLNSFRGDVEMNDSRPTLRRSCIRRSKNIWARKSTCPASIRIPSTQAGRM